MKKVSLFFSLLFFVGAAVCSEKRSDCPMDIHPIDLKGQAVSYDNFDQERAEHLVRYVDGDLLIVRYNAECELGVDMAFFSMEGLNDRTSREKKAAWLISLFRNYEDFNLHVRQELHESKLLNDAEFSMSIPGEYGDEEHFISLKNVSVSDDFQSLLFKQLMTYSWLPPSGE